MFSPQMALTPILIKWTIAQLTRKTLLLQFGAPMDFQRKVSCLYNLIDVYANQLIINLKFLL
jgi:hypothetical protein